MLQVKVNGSSQERVKGRESGLWRPGTSQARHEARLESQVPGICRTPPGDGALVAGRDYVSILFRCCAVGYGVIYTIRENGVWRYY